jgi:hypothetical protein
VILCGIDNNNTYSPISKADGAAHEKRKRDGDGAISSKPGGRGAPISGGRRNVTPAHEMETMMNKLLLSAALAAALATPAFAQSFDRDYGTGNVNGSLGVTAPVHTGSVDRSYAYAPRRAHATETRSLRGPAEDPNIALQQRRDDQQY